MKYISKYILAFLLFALISPAGISQENSNDKFRKGVSLYTGGKINEALNVWLDIYNTGYRSPELAYNIGNAYFKLNSTAQAILFYERAWLLAPANENINYNLQIARTLTIDKFQEIPQLFFVRWYDFVSLLFSTNSWAVTSLILFLAALASFLFYLYSAGHRIKVITFFGGILLIIFSLSSLMFSLRNKSLVYDSHKAVIISASVSGKSSPENNGTDLFVLHEGTKVSVEDVVGNWYEVRLSDGNKGWIEGTALNII